MSSKRKFLKIFLGILFLLIVVIGVLTYINFAKYAKLHRLTKPLIFVIPTPIPIRGIISEINATTKRYYDEGSGFSVDIPLPYVPLPGGNSNCYGVKVCYVNAQNIDIWKQDASSNYTGQSLSILHMGPKDLGLPEKPDLSKGDTYTVDLSIIPSTFHIPSDAVVNSYTVTSSNGISQNINLYLFSDKVLYDSYSIGCFDKKSFNSCSYALNTILATLKIPSKAEGTMKK